jgi:hypothetical protein
MPEPKKEETKGDVHEDYGAKMRRKKAIRLTKKKTKR